MHTHFLVCFSAGVAAIETLLSSWSGAGARAQDDGGSGGSSSDASDIDKSELDALLDESRDVLGDSAAGGGRPTKRVRR